MKSFVRRHLVVLSCVTTLMATAVPLQSRAMVCLGDPITCGIAAIGLIAGAIAGVSSRDGNPKALATGDDLATIQNVATDLESDDKFLRSLFHYSANNSPSYYGISKKVKKGYTQTLQWDFEKSKIFKTLDKFEIILAKHYPASEMTRVYGTVFAADGSVDTQSSIYQGQSTPNWNRYALLATDVDAMLHNRQTKAVQAKDGPPKIYWQKEHYGRE